METKELRLYIRCGVQSLEELSLESEMVSVLRMGLEMHGVGGCPVTPIASCLELPTGHGQDVAFA